MTRKRLRKEIADTKGGAEGPAEDWGHLKTLGMVAGGLAHDLNNQLVLIAHTAELAEMLDEPERYRTSCAQIREICDRARELVGRLQDFGRGADREPRRLNLTLFTEATVRLARHAGTRGASLAWTAPTVEGPQVKGRAVELQELFLLALQAGAMEQGGGTEHGARLRIDIVREAGGWGWRFSAVGGAAPTWWRNLAGPDADGGAEEAGAADREARVRELMAENGLHAAVEDEGRALRVWGLPDAGGEEELVSK